jgi:glycine dehydrogenase
MTFIKRHIGPSKNDIELMCQEIGVKDVEMLIDQTIPPHIQSNSHLLLENPLSESEYLNHIRDIGNKNILAQNHIGQGYYGTHTPSVILRNIFENPGWYTQYTPYQAEISQGRLESLFNFQTLITELTALPVANASLLDEGSAAAEAMLLMYRSRSKEKKDAQTLQIISPCFTQTIDILKTRAKAIGIAIEVTPAFEPKSSVFGVMYQYPDAQGKITDFSEVTKQASSLNIQVTAIADLLSLTLITPPGKWGADITVGTTQRFGIPMGYGGPHAGYISAKETYSRQLPGRIIGKSIDKHGQTAYRMALQTREQHIRKEKATSNICTAQALLANMASMYAIYHGPNGLKEIASEIHTKTTQLARELHERGYLIQHEMFFDTLCISCDEKTKNSLQKSAKEKKINFFYKDSQILLSLDETTTQEHISNVLSVFTKITHKQEKKPKTFTIHASLLREQDYMKQSIFSDYQTETELMRYITTLENKDLSLRNSMIPLGSCTMKLNAATQLIPVSWPMFSSLHPFCPLEQAEGYKTIIDSLEKDLAHITGLSAVSLQPNSGAQGEYAGLLTIKRYLESIGQENRNIALIPTSAHGTNPASAVMAGLKVIPIACDKSGNIDFQDLQNKLKKYGEDLAVLMVTYPSTHGVFEESIIDICKWVHEYGGQVYMDGANMNAQVGLTSPGFIGADVCHLNLHKTFAIPHGGGGPGVGPIAVAAHLSTFLPSHTHTTEQDSFDCISSSPWGSASILLISYAYIKMLGAEGLKSASQCAILNANYIRKKLQNIFPVLFTGTHGHVAHELIIDMRPFKKSANIDVEDIAKRLMDYGYHAPTMSWPVPGTLMIEPTESEGKRELDNFCEAMINIYKEIQEIVDKKYDTIDNPLKEAPHTQEECISDNWTHAYSREKAAFPLTYIRGIKFWPTVGRLNQAYGDRNLICSCDTVESYALSR